MQLAFRHLPPVSLRTLEGSRSFTTRTVMAPPKAPAGLSISKKRPTDDLDEHGGTALKKAKLFPIFAKPGAAPEETGPFKWAPALGPNKTCLHGVNLSPQPSTKVAAFDLDGCVIESSFGKGKGKAKAADPIFRWWHPVVPKKLKQLHEEGYSVVMITNQALRPDALKQWRMKIPLIATALPEVPFYLFAATGRDNYRKPMPGMWYELETIFAKRNVVIDKQSSFFIGDAAGRKDDFSGTDRKWALNLNIPFHTPEEYFLGLKPAEWKLQGFHVSSLPTNEPHILPTSTPLIPIPKSGATEVVLFVGFPALGKSSFYHRYFKPARYMHINQDTLKSRDKCVKAVGTALADGQSCVVDNTNRDKATRKFYVDVARKHGARIRCVLFKGSLELAWHNNLYRAFNMPPHSVTENTKRDLVPYSAFANFKSTYEEPTLAEGFSEIKTVNWKFEGDDEERVRWSMWLQIDGK